MLILTAATIGMLAVGTRSVLSCMMCGFMIVAVFALSAATGSAVSWLSLVAAVLAYNMGIAAMLGLSIMANSRRHA